MGHSDFKWDDDAYRREQVRMGTFRWVASLWLILLVLGTRWTVFHWILIFLLANSVSGLARDVIQRWSKTIQLLGRKRALQGALLKARIRYRQSLGGILLTAPGMMFVWFGGCWVAFGKLPSGVFDPQTGFLLLVVAYAVTHSLKSLAPPAVLFLSLSEHEPYEILRRLQTSTSLEIASLIDMTSLRVRTGLRPQYPGHEVLIRFAELVSNSFAYDRLSSVRGRDSRWQETVRDLVEFVPIVIIDTRYHSAPIAQESVWLLAPERRHKAIFLADEDGNLPVLDGLLSETEIVCLDKVRAEELPDVLVASTSGRTSLPRRTHVVGPAMVAAVTTAQKRLDTRKGSLQHMIRMAEVGGPALDDQIAAWERGDHDSDDSTAAPAPYSTDLDLALALIRRRIPGCSIQIDIYTDGTARSEIALYGASGVMRVSASDGSGRLVPSRSALQALFRAELG